MPLGELNISNFMTNIFPGIEKTPGVMGGEACVMGTRIPVWLLVRMRQLGSDDETIFHAYPNLQTDDLTHAWEYYLAHKEEIERLIVEHESF